MKRLALLSTVVAIAALTLFATSAAQSDPGGGGPGSVGVMYDMFEGQPDGVLSVVNAGGMFIEVFAITGEPVWAGVVPGNFFTFGCPNRGAAPQGEILTVYTSGGAHFCIDRDEDWYWD
jgi:hypothetical protein